MNTVKQKIEREKEENRKRVAEKDKLLSRRALQINTLQGINNSSYFLFTKITFCHFLVKVCCQFIGSWFG